MTQGSSRPDLSYAKLVIFSIGAATLVLIVTAVLVVSIPAPAGVLLAIAIIGVFAAVAALGVVATRITNRAFGDSDDPEHSDPHPTQ